MFIKEESHVKDRQRQVRRGCLVRKVEWQEAEECFIKTLASVMGTWAVLLGCINEWIETEPA